MCARSAGFYLDGDESKEQDLPRAHGAVPHGAADAVGVGEGRGGEECGTPCPGGDDAGSDETGFDGAGG